MAKKIDWIGKPKGKDKITKVKPIKLAQATVGVVLGLSMIKAVTKYI